MDLLIEILNFVNANYLKFAIGLVLSLMAIIGYYAEKTNFGNKLKEDTTNDFDSKQNTFDDKIGLNDAINRDLKNPSIDSGTNINQISEENLDNVNNANIANIDVTTDVAQNGNSNPNSINNINSNINSISNVTQPVNPIYNNVGSDINSSDTITNVDGVDKTALVIESQNNNEMVNITNNVNEEMIDKSLSSDYKNELTQNSIDNNVTDVDLEFDKTLSKGNSVSDDLIIDIENLKVDPLEKKDTSNIEKLVKLNSNIELPEIEDLKNDSDIWKF